MSAKIINLAAYRKAKRVRAMWVRLQRGEIRLPTSAELHRDLKRP